MKNITPEQRAHTILKDMTIDLRCEPPEITCAVDELYIKIVQEIKEAVQEREFDAKRFVNRPGEFKIEYDDDLREAFAKLAHEQWAGWMEYLFQKSIMNDDGTVTIPKWAVDRWKRQAATPYDLLSTAEQDSDRIEADKFIEVLKDVQNG